MVVKPQHIYGSYTFGWKKQTKAVHRIKITSSVKLKSYRYKEGIDLNAEWTINGLINALKGTWMYFFVIETDYTTANRIQHITTALNKPLTTCLSHHSTFWCLTKCLWQQQSCQLVLLKSLNEPNNTGCSALPADWWSYHKAYLSITWRSAIELIVARSVSQWALST